MTVTTWFNGKSGLFTSGTNWSGGVAPESGDTAVISGKGDPAPLSNVGPDGVAFGPVTGDSVVDLFTGQIDNGLPGTITVYEPGQPLFTFSVPDPAESQIPVGDIINGETLDFEGSGSLAAALLQRTTLGATSVVNVSGSTVFEGFYDNSLSGTINIGVPFSVSGKAVPAPAVNAHGLRSELDIDLQGDGSWSGKNGDSLDGYVPTTTNAGQITIATGSRLLVDAFATGGGTVSTVVGNILIPPKQVGFANTGTITVQAGGKMEFANSDALYWSPLNYPGDLIPKETILATLTNNGLIQIDGALKSTTTATLEGNITGSGTIAVNGGTATNAAATTLNLSDARVNTNLTLRDGTITLSNEYGRTVPFAGAIGGSLTFEDGKSVFNVFDTSLTNGLFPLTGMQVDGFQKGDQINVLFNAGLAILPPPGVVPGFVATWSQATHTLSLESVYKAWFGGETTVDLGAMLKLQGTYAANSFTATLVADSSTSTSLVSGDFEVRIMTSVTNPGSVAAAGVTQPLSAADLLPSAADMLAGQFAPATLAAADQSAVLGGATASEVAGSADAGLAAGLVHLTA